MYENDNELYHHGVKGQKWGQHRYKDQSGNLTDRGKKKFAQVEKSKLQSWQHTRQAKGILKYEAKTASKDAEKYEKQAAKYNKEYAKNAFDAEQYGEMGAAKKSKTAYDKAAKAKAASNAYAKAAEANRMLAQSANKMLKDIDSGQLKAGRDFIFQMDTDSLFSNTTNYRIVERNGKELSKHGYSITSSYVRV